MIHAIPDSIDYQLWLQNPRDPCLQRLVVEALRDQGKMHDFRLKAVRGKAALFNTAIEIPAHVVAEIMVKFREAVAPDQLPLLFPCDRSNLDAFPFLRCTSNTRPPDRSLPLINPCTPIR